MKTSRDYFNIQKQLFVDDSNLIGDNELSPDYDARKKNLFEKFEKIRKESKYSFVVDWQIPENL
jgi:hypothetical protein